MHKPSPLDVGSLLTMVTKQKSWPGRYLVTIQNVSGGIFRYKVTTGLDDRKAIALAAVEHQKRQGHNPRNVLYDISVEDIGLASPELEFFYVCFN